MSALSTERHPTLRPQEQVVTPPHGAEARVLPQAAPASAGRAGRGKGTQILQFPRLPIVRCAASVDGDPITHAASPGSAVARGPDPLARNGMWHAAVLPTSEDRV